MAAFQVGKRWRDTLASGVQAKVFLRSVKHRVDREGITLYSSSKLQDTGRSLCTARTDSCNFAQVVCSKSSGSLGLAARAPEDHQVSNGNTKRAAVFV